MSVNKSESKNVMHNKLVRISHILDVHKYRESIITYHLGKDHDQLYRHL